MLVSRFLAKRSHTAFARARPIGRAKDFEVTCRGSARKTRPEICASRTRGRAHDGSRSTVVFLDKEERLFPEANHPGQEYEKKPIGLSVRRAFDRLARRTISCCRKSACSANSSALPLVRSTSVPSAREVVGGFIQRKTCSGSV
jgi:hypothetical protein